MNAFIWKIARPIALGLAFSWAVVLMGCGGTQAARKSPATPQMSNAEREAQARAEAERKAKEEAERVARVEAERKAKEEAERVARAEAERKAREEAERAARARAFDESVYFAYDSHAIRSDQKPVLTRLAEKLQANPGYRVTIAGYADERGTPEYNRALGQKRADAIKRVLVKKGKIDPGRLTTISYGKTRPANPGHGEKAWSKNRRTTFDVTESSGQVETSRQ